MKIWVGGDLDLCRIALNLLDIIVQNLYIDFIMRCNSQPILPLGTNMFMIYATRKDYFVMVPIIEFPERPKQIGHQQPKGDWKHVYPS